MYAKLVDAYSCHVALNQYGVLFKPWPSTRTDRLPSLQVVRAKERIEMEIDEKVCPDPTPGDSPEDSDSSSKPP